MYERKNLFSYIFYLFLTGILTYIWGPQAGIELWWILLLYSSILYIFSYIWKYIRKKDTPKFIHFFNMFLLKSSFWLCIGICLFWGFMLVQNELNPAKLPLYTLTNGQKVVYFQTMSHIGSQRFYTQVQNNIIAAKKDGAVLFFEWVRPGTKENQEAFNNALWMKFDAELYNNFSRLYGVVAQDNDMFLKRENEKDYNIDLSLDEVMDLYHKKNPPNQAQTHTLPQSADLNVYISQTLWALSEKQLSLLQYMNQSLLNFIIKHESLRENILENFWNPDIFSVILDERNKNLVNEILQSPENKIFILYGLMHFSWVLQLLQDQDSQWKIIKREDYTIIQKNALSE